MILWTYNIRSVFIIYFKNILLFRIAIPRFTLKILRAIPASERFLWPQCFWLLYKRKIFHTAASFVFSFTSYGARISLFFFFFTANSNASRNFSPVKCVKFEVHALRPGIKACLCRHFETFIRSNTWQFSLLSPTRRFSHLSFSSSSPNLLRIRVRNCTDTALCSFATSPLNICATNPLRICTTILNYIREHRIHGGLLGLAFLNRSTHWSRNSPIACERIPV